MGRIRAESIPYQLFMLALWNEQGTLAWISKYARQITGTPAGPFTISDMGPGREKGERYEYLMPAEDAK